MYLTIINSKNIKIYFLIQTALDSLFSTFVAVLKTNV
ncbi:hypothetical protein BXY80_1146 [Ichthyenterobacterium magnum]|uniref:Uncharacterized protein n=1 Tax=Ichthyenterobacterium magnum TaxID=1230530 RepID=A0A420DXU5_9FLAO|nr:hypothetical protein BXY80_1146 [Ichthyenterobacterium magnum]